MGRDCPPLLRDVLSAAAERFALDLAPLHEPEHAPLQAVRALGLLLEHAVNAVDSVSAAAASQRPAVVPGSSASGSSEGGKS
jgi:hypothetical protein